MSHHFALLAGVALYRCLSISHTTDSTQRKHQVLCQIKSGGMEPPAGVAPQLGELIIIVSPISRTTDSTHITVSPQVSRNFLVSPRVTQLSRLETQTKHPVFTERHVSLSSRSSMLLHSNYSKPYYQWVHGYSKVVAGKGFEPLIFWL